MGLKRDGGSSFRKTQPLSIADLQYHQTCEIVPRSCFLRTSPFNVTKAKSIANLQYHQTCENVPRSCFLRTSPIKVLDDVYLHPAFLSPTALYQNTQNILQRRRRNKSLLLIVILGLQVTLSKGMLSNLIKYV